MSKKLASRAQYALLAAMAVTLLTPRAYAEPVDDWHTWSAVVATGGLGDNESSWLYWLEGQARFNDDSSRFNQAIVRGALGRKVAQNAALWAGYAFIPGNRPRSSDNIAEHRIWQQFTWGAQQPVMGFTLSTRTRLEQRTIESADDTGWRFRQLVKLVRPLDDESRWYLSLWNELFVHLNDTDWGADSGIDQNRVFAGIGLTTSPQARVEVGYMNQYVDRAARANARNHVLSLTLLLNF